MERAFITIIGLVIVLSLLLGGAEIVFGQSQASQDSRIAKNDEREANRRAKIRKDVAKQNLKTERKRQKREEAALKKAKKRHYMLQTPETRARMDYRQRRAGYNYEPRGRSFWDKVFGRKKP